MLDPKANTPQLEIRAYRRHTCADYGPGCGAMMGLDAEKLAAFPDVACGVAVKALRERAAGDRQRAGAETAATIRRR